MDIVDLIAAALAAGEQREIKDFCFPRKRNEMAAKGSLVLLCYMVVAAACVKLPWQWLLPAGEKGEGRLAGV